MHKAIQGFAQPMSPKFGVIFDAVLFESQVGGVTVAMIFCIDFPKFGVIFDAVLFESRVGGVAVAMTFASIFHLSFGSFGVSL